MRKNRRGPFQPNFNNQTWLVTGASHGIGAMVAEIAALHGARVIVVARSHDKMQAQKARLHRRLARGEGRHHRPGGTIIPVVCDLGDMRAISDLVARLKRKVKIDVLINNVGTLNENYEQSPHGGEQSYSVNLLGHYHLTESLWRGGVFQRAPLLIEVSSGGLYTQPLNLARLDQYSDGFDGWTAYASHKRAQIALTDHWRRKYRSAGIFAYTMHPGWVKTPGIAASMPRFHKLLKPILRTTEQGADSVIWLAQKRPATRENIVWFDRKQRKAHIFADTRMARTSTQGLLDHLERDVRRALKG